MISPIMYVILSFVPVGILALVLETWRHYDKQGPSAGGNEMLLRSPGDSSRRQIEQLDGKIWEITLWIFGFPSTLLLCYLSSIGTSPLSNPISTVWIIAFVVAAVAVMALVWKWINLVRGRNHWRLAFSCERAVGEHLNQLLSDGCRVFHDYPIAGNGNLTHIVIAPSGVFAIETRAHRKSVASPSQQAHEVVYDGKSLEFPYHKDSKDLDHVRGLAERLTKFLREHLEVPITVKPVLTFPGWYVIVRGEGDVIVLNPKKLDAAILAPTTEALSVEQIKQIARLFEQKCRDVEF